MPGPSEHVVARLRAAGCVYAEEEAELLCSEAQDDDDLERLVGRRAAGEPIEHVLGWAAFAGLRLVVQPGVFVPRRRTELLAREAARLCRPGSVVVELCCGCAPVAAVVAATVADATIAAADIDPVAVGCARLNLPPTADVSCGDLYDALPDGFRRRIDVLVANAPYVPHQSLELMPREARLYEPQVALDGGSDGLDVHRRLLDGSADWLAAGGHVLIEVAEEQVSSLASLFRARGLQPEVIHDADIAGTVMVANRPVRVSGR